MSQQLVLQYDTPLPFDYGAQQITCTLTKITGTAIKMQPEYLDTLVALYHHVLPNAPVEQIRIDLQDPNLTHLLIYRSEDNVRQDFHEKPIRMFRQYQKKYDPTSNDNIEEYSNDSNPDEDLGNDLLLKSQDFIKNRKKTQFDKFVKSSVPGLVEKATNTKLDLDLIDCQRINVRIRDQLIGAVSLKNLTLEKIQITQLLYIGVRVRFQLMKLGRCLLQTAIYNETHNSDVFITFAGSDSVRFFRNGGFTDDPLIAGRFQQLQSNIDAKPMILLLKQSNVQKMVAADEKWGAYRASAFERYSAESFFVKQLIEENSFLQNRVVNLEKIQETFDQQLALERSRCIMYEQLVQSLETQLLAAGIKPKVDQEEIIKKSTSANTIQRTNQCAKPRASIKRSLVRNNRLLENLKSAGDANDSYGASSSNNQQVWPL